MIKSQLAKQEEHRLQCSAAKEKGWLTLDANARVCEPNTKLSQYRLHLETKKKRKRHGKKLLLGPVRSVMPFPVFVGQKQSRDIENDEETKKTGMDLARN